MFAYFRINDPYRLIGIFLLLILIRLPAFITGTPLTIPELNWMIIGEKLSSGAALYLEVWDDIAPLSAIVYWLIDELFGRSQVAYQIISLVLVFIQGFIFNNALINYKAYNENTYIPALIYSISASMFFDFYTLSPVMMGLTFILLAVKNIFSQVEHRAAEDNLLNTGIYLGLATLFYLTYSLFIIAIIFSYLIFTGTSLKKHLLFLYGFTLPILIVMAFFYMKDGLHAFYTNYIYSIIYLDNKMLMGYMTLIVLMIVPFIFLALSFLKLFEVKRYINIQVRYQQVMFFMLVMAVFVWLAGNNKTPHQLLVFIPFVAFFVSHYLLLIRKRFITEITFLAFFTLLMMINYGSLYKLPYFEINVDYHDLLVKDTKWDQEVKGKKILVLGNHLSVYRNARHATPYLNWDLSTIHLEHINYYDNLTAIYSNFKKDMPEVIVDEKGIAPELFQRMPTISSQYKKGPIPGAYVLTEAQNK